MAAPKFKKLTPKALETLDRTLRYYGYNPKKESKAEATKKLYQFLVERADKDLVTDQDVEKFLEGIAPGSKMEQKKFASQDLLRIAVRVAADELPINNDFVEWAAKKYPAESFKPRQADPNTSWWTPAGDDRHAAKLLEEFHREVSKPRRDAEMSQRKRDERGIE